MLVYSVTSDASFKAIPKIKDDIERIRESPRLPMVLVGNKCDLIQERSIKHEMGAARATEYGCPFFETSARDNKNIQEGFRLPVF